MTGSRRIVLLTLLIASFWARGQSLPSGAESLLVTDPTGVPIYTATVLVSPNGWTGHADSAGRIALPELRKGSELIVSAQGFRPRRLTADSAALIGKHVVLEVGGGSSVEVQPVPEPRDAPQTRIARISAGVMARQVVSKVMPVFPREAIEAHVNGAVVMHVIIGRDGHVAEITPVSGPQMLRQAFMDAVRQWVYQPYLLNGEPIEVDTTITLSLQMGGVGTPPSQQLPSPPSGPIRISSGVLAGNKISGKWPNLCEIKREQRVSGGVVLHVIVNKTGSVSEVTVVSGPQIWRQAAIDAVRGWRYKPYLLNGEPVEVDSTVTMNPNCGG